MGEEIIQNKELLILEAAEREFITKGYDGARTTSIAKEAGVTHAMLHYYFRTKEQLFERIIEKKMSEITPLLTYLFGNDKLPLTERIKEAVSVHFDFIVANPDLPKFLINEVLPNKERFIVLKSKIDKVLYLFKNLQKEVDEAALRGEVEQFNIINLFQTILSLNIFSSVMPLFMENILGENEFTTKDFLAARKAENIETIMRRIKKI
ncbi:MAG: helix-turn-helix transcriptional regulator [Muribaculaceae bacterium]|nr:helix-turn-helix transcriptional regulator [Muribaculaceae bacterium]